MTKLTKRERELYNLLTNIETYGVMLHGTSKKAYKQIKKQGLTPRRKRAATWIGEGEPSKRDRVYLTTLQKFGCGPFQTRAADFAAREAADKHNSKPIVLHVKLKKGMRIVADEDIHDCLDEDYPSNIKDVFSGMCLPEEFADMLEEKRYTKKELRNVEKALPLWSKSLICQGSIAVVGKIRPKQIIDVSSDVIEARKKR